MNERPRAQEARPARIENLEQVREDIFRSIVNRKLLESFEDALGEADLDDHIDEWGAALTALAGQSPEYLSALLAVPHELKVRRVQALQNKVTEDTSLEQVLMDAAIEAYNEGYRVGYHASPHDIKPTKDPKTGRETWSISGYENDHRDDDLSMAYYSTNFESMYRRKNPKKVYLIRAHQSPEGGHRQDNDGAWGRAPKLDVIDVIDYAKTMEEVEKRILDLQRERAKAQRAGEV